MDPFTMMQAGIAVAGLVTNLLGKNKQKKAQKQQFAWSKKEAEATLRAEKAREQMMELDNRRTQREAVRNALIARSTALSRASSQGAGEGSGLQGAYGEISGRTNQKITESAENTVIGRSIFAANRDATNARTMQNFYGGKASQGQATAQVGQSLFNNAEPAAKLGMQVGDFGVQSLNSISSIFSSVG